MGHTQRGITDFAGLLAKDGAEQALLSGQLGLTLRGDLADQNVAALDLGTDADDAALVQIFQGILGDVGDITGDLLRSELGVTGLGLVLFNMDRCVHILADDLLVQQDSVLVVVALPGHKVDQVVTDEVEYMTADVEDEYVVAQANEPLDETKHFIRPRVSARRRDDILEIDADKVDYMDVSPRMMVSVATACIPFLENDDCNRALMGSNMQRQAVPLMVTQQPIIRGETSI